MKFLAATFNFLFLSFFALNSLAQPKEFVKLMTIDSVTYYRASMSFYDLNEWFVFAKSTSDQEELMILRAEGCESPNEYKRIFKNGYTSSNSMFYMKGQYEPLLAVHKALCESSRPGSGGGLMSIGQPLKIDQISTDYVYVKEGKLHKLRSIKTYGTAHRALVATLIEANKICRFNNKSIWVESRDWGSVYGFFSSSYNATVTFDCVDAGGSDLMEPYNESSIHIIPGPFGLLGVLDANGFIQESRTSEFPRVAGSFCNSKSQRLLASPTNSYGNSPFRGFHFYCID